MVQSWCFYFFLASGDILDGVCGSSHIQRAKEFGGDNFIDYVCTSVGVFYISHINRFHHLNFVREVP